MRSMGVARVIVCALTLSRPRIRGYAPDVQVRSSACQSEKSYGRSIGSPMVDGFVRLHAGVQINGSGVLCLIHPKSKCHKGSQGILLFRDCWTKFGGIFASNTTVCAPRRPMLD